MALCHVARASDGVTAVTRKTSNCHHIGYKLRSAGCQKMRDMRLKRAAALRQRAHDLRLELEKRPYLAATLLAVIEELDHRADELERTAQGECVPSKNG